jgi:hypothetical protein
METVLLAVIGIIGYLIFFFIEPDKYRIANYLIAFCAGMLGATVLIILSETCK